MSIDNAFGIARSGLLATQRALAIVSQNIANADSPGYTRKSLPVTAASWGDQPLGVRLGEVSRQVNDTLLAERDARGAEQAAARLRESLLTPIEATQGATGDGTSVADSIGALRASFLLLRGSPADNGLQRDAAFAAREVATRFNEAGRAIGEARNAAQRAIVEEVNRFNTALREVSELTTAIRGNLASGLSAAELEDKRDMALSRLSESLPVRATRHPDGGVTLISGGLAIPLFATEGPLETTGVAGVAPAAFHGGMGGLPGVMLAGVDVTRQLAGGRLAEAVALRDQVLPRFQAEMDLAASHLAARLDSQGLRLFTDPQGNAPDVTLPYNDPASRQLGFANVIRVNPAILDTPRLIRDGTHDVAAGGPTDPTAFTRNPPTGPAGFTTLIDRVTEHALGETLRPGVGWAALPATGLGPDGTLRSPFVPPLSIEGYAAAVVSAQSAERARATENAERAGKMLRGVEGRLEQESGVNADAEMALLVQLQNAYAANARVISTTQTMFDQLFALGR